MTFPRLVAIKGANLTAFDGTLDFIVTVQPREGSSPEDWPFHYVPGDRAPMTLAVKDWLAAHPKFKPGPRPVPSSNPLDYPLTRRQVRFVFIGLGLPADAVDIALVNVEDRPTREMLRIEWFEGRTFRRDDPVVVHTALHWVGIEPPLTDARIDKRWLEIARLGFT